MREKLLPRKTADIKGKVALAELKRAHWIIVVLSLALAFVVTIEANQQVSFNVILATTADVLLLVIALLSFMTATRLK